MEAMIIRTDLIKTKKGHYFNVELMDKLNNKYTFGRPGSSDPMNFRMQVYGIMNACDEKDLLSLTTHNPKYLNVSLFTLDGVRYIERDDKVFYYDPKSRLYRFENETHEVEHKDKCLINTINFKDGEIRMVLETELGYKIYKTGKIDYMEGIKSRETAHTYSSFIVSLMKLYNKKDLLLLGGNIEKYPEVDIKLNTDGSVKRLSNPYTGKSLYISNMYEIKSRK